MTYRRILLGLGAACICPDIALAAGNQSANARRAASIPAYSGTATYALDKTCDGLGGTCAMAACQTMNTAPSCEFTAATYDAAKEVSKYKCQTCTQAADPRCKADFLKSVFKGDGVEAAYCNDKNLVILTSGAPSHTPDLENIVIPPGGTVNGVACVTRTWSKKWKHWQIPVKGKYTLLSTADRNNNANTASFPGGPGDAGYLSHADNGIYGLPQRGPTGVSTGGEEVFPVFSDQVVLTPESCEVDSCNEHVGQGGGAPHLHGDPFHTTAGKCLYSPADYSSVDVHPPVVGFSLDGPSIHGRYLSTNAPGYSVALDDCGGHIHDDYEYHYHAQVKSGAATSKNKAKAATGTEFAAFPFGPDQCYKADISSIAGFWSGNPVTEYTAPCCGMTEYYTNGVTIDGAGTLATGTTAAGTTAAGTTAAGTTAAATTAAGTAAPTSASTCDYGTCGSGNDDSGKACPPDYGNGKPNCPAGCTAVASTDCATSSPTDAPTEAPTDAPTTAPTKAGETAAPTDAPTEAPTNAPTSAPTAAAGTAAPATPTVIVGSVNMEVADPDAFIADTALVTATKEGIAASIGADASYVKIVVTKVAGRRLESEKTRQLAAGSVKVDYTISIPVSASSTAAAISAKATTVTVAELTTAVQTKVTAAKPGTTVTVTSKTVPTSTGGASATVTQAPAAPAAASGTSAATMQAVLVLFATCATILN